MEMSFCNEHGIPHSEFLLWEPEDRSKALAFIIEQGSKCGLCGTAEWEWDANRRAYEPVEKFCMGCYLKHMAGEDSGRMPGTTINLEPANSRNSMLRLAKMKKAHLHG